MLLLASASRTEPSMPVHAVQYPIGIIFLAGHTPAGSGLPYLAAHFRRELATTWSNLSKRLMRKLQSIRAPYQTNHNDAIKEGLITGKAHNVLAILYHHAKS